MTKDKSSAPKYHSSRIPKEFGIIFDSNASGSFGIYYLRRGLTAPVPLVDSELQEMYPDVSDESDSVVFARSKTTNRIEPGSIWKITRQTKQPILLIENGTFPTFVDHGKAILFERQRSEVIRHDLKTGETKKVFPFGTYEKKFKDSQIVKPRLSVSGRYLVFTSDKPAPWHAWIVDLQEGEAKLLARACEPTIHPSDQFGVLIDETKAVGGSGLYTFSLPQASEVTPYIDPTEALSHEYFPSFNSDGTWIAFGACSPEEHSHLSANYELFLKNVDGENSPVQITETPSTERWPKFTHLTWDSSEYSYEGNE